MKNLLFVLTSMLILFFSYSCNKKEKTLDIIPEVQVNPSLKALYKKDIVVDTKFIPLRVSDDFMIESFSDIIVEDSLIFISDVLLNTIFIYDFFGIPVTKIHSFGGGPGEYLNITNIFIDRYDHTVNVFDISKYRIITYDYSGKFLKEKTLKKDKSLQYIIKTPNSPCYISEMNNPNKDILCAFDDQQQLIDKTLSIKNKEAYAPYLACMRRSRFTTHNDTVFFISIYDYSIYSFKSGHFKKEYNLIMDDQLKISSIKLNEKTTKSSLDAIRDYFNKGYISNIFSFTVNDNYISFGIEVNGNGFKNYNILYNRQTHESVFYEDLYSNRESGRLYQPPFFGSYKDYFIFLVRSSEELKYITKSQSFSLDDPETPILCFVKLKD